MDAAALNSEATLTLPESKRRSYSRERKLEVLKYYYENGRNKYRTCQKFNIAKGSLYLWLKNEKQIHDGSKGSKRIEGGGRKPFWPDVEEKLLAEFTELRAKGLKAKHYWFRTRAMQLMSELHPDVDFKFSPGWFDRFKARQKISCRPSTNVAQLEPTGMEDKIRTFHLEIQHTAALKDSEEPLGKFQSSTVTSVDQINNSFSASQRGVLIMGWVGAALAEVCQNKEILKHGFEECGISIPINGSRNEEINIRGLTDYVVRKDSPDIETEDDDLLELDCSDED